MCRSGAAQAYLSQERRLEKAQRGGIESRRRADRHRERTIVTRRAVGLLLLLSSRGAAREPLIDGRQRLLWEVAHEIAPCPHHAGIGADEGACHVTSPKMRRAPFLAELFVFGTIETGRANAFTSIARGRDDRVRKATRLKIVVRHFS